MRLKSFHGPNLTETMRMVRDALGEDAIIVATRDDETGGIRVTAAIDDVPLYVDQSMPVAEPQPEGSEAIEIIAESMTRHHVYPALAEKIMAGATQFANDDAVLTLSAALDAHFKFAPIIEDRTDKPLILVGPPGAGKTLSIAKFATRATLGKRPVTVISTDLERAGGMEQLAAFTRLLKLNLIEIEDPHALQDAIQMQSGEHIFIDTAGRNPFIESERQITRAFIKAAGGDATLVLPAGMDAAEAIDMAQEFKRMGATRLLVTRIDMTRRLGCVLRIAAEAQLALANYSMTGKVTEAPQPFNPVALARMLLPPQAAQNETKSTGTNA